MNDYKELIAKCDYWINLGDEIDKKLAVTKFMEECRDAIEQLVKERDNIIAVANKLGKRYGACDICGADCQLSHSAYYCLGACEHWKLGIERSETDVR